MRHFHWAILIGELILLALALAVPRMDLPQTAFNETDTPVNQATVVVVLGCRTALTGLRSAVVTHAVGAPRPAHVGGVVEFTRQQHLRSRSLLTLLCAFLC